jgi:hypothetical protein
MLYIGFHAFYFLFINLLIYLSKEIVTCVQFHQGNTKYCKTFYLKIIKNYKTIPFGISIKCSFMTLIQLSKKSALNY